MIPSVEWIPDWGEQRMEQMIELHPEWCLSRQRTWGTPIPAIDCTSCNESILDPAVARKAAERCAKANLILLLENEMSCNTATGEESAAVLKAIPNRNFMLNWDPGNAAASGEKPFPDGYNLLPKERIGHCHCKDAVRKGAGYDWAPMGGGIVDWLGQFQALKRDGYHFAVSLETHWRGAGTPEASSRISMKGLKDSLAKAGLNC